MIAPYWTPRTIWMVLMALTLLSFLIGERHWLGHYSGYLVVALAATKARWVVLDFMEARCAPGPWRWMFEGWLAVGALIMSIVVAVG